MNRKLTVTGIILVLLIIAIPVSRTIASGGKIYTLRQAPPLTGQISQALASQSDKPTVPIAPADYTLHGTTYFDAGSWAVTSIVPTDKNAQQGMVVLQKKAGVFVVVLGPGTSFPSSAARSLPADVAQYLNTRGYLYDAVQ